MSYQSMLIDNVIIKRRSLSSTPDSIGGITNVAGGQYTVRGRIRQLNAEERDVQGRSGISSTHRVYLLPNEVTGLQKEDIVEIQNVEYEVNFIDDIHLLGRVMQVDVTLRD